MSKIDNILVAVFLSKNKLPGDPGWAFVRDFNNRDDFINWFTERRIFYKHVAVTKLNAFKVFEEIDEFKAFLKGMLCIGATPNFTDEQFDKYDDMNMDMKHYLEKDFDLMVKDYREDKIIWE